MAQQRKPADVIIPVGRVEGRAVGLPATEEAARAVGAGNPVGEMLAKLARAVSGWHKDEVPETLACDIEPQGALVAADQTMQRG